MEGNSNEDWMAKRNSKTQQHFVNYPQQSQRDSRKMTKTIGVAMTQVSPQQSLGGRHDMDVTPSHDTSVTLYITGITIQFFLSKKETKKGKRSRLEDSPAPFLFLATLIQQHTYHSILKSSNVLLRDLRMNILLKDFR